MEESKIRREKVRMSESDLSYLESQVDTLIETILDSYECISEDDKSFPKKYVIIQNGKKYEFIFSQIGSFTIRALNEEKQRLHYAPLFYISVSKYSDETFQWEEINGDKIDIESSKLIEDINKQLMFFEMSSLQ